MDVIATWDAVSGAHGGILWALVLFTTRGKVPMKQTWGNTVPVGGAQELAQSLLPDSESELPSSGSFRATATGESLERQSRVLLGLPGDSERSALARTLRFSGLRVLEIDPMRADWSALVPREELDIAVLHAGCLSLNYAELAHVSDFGYPELVFVVDEGCPAQRLALMSRGYRHVVGASDLSYWLHGQLTSLCALANARRIVLAACSESTPVLELTLGASALGGMNLHVAETHFRETFLRALLVEHGSRRRAAEAAGVPYRSFCEMLRKLGI